MQVLSKFKLVMAKLSTKLSFHGKLSKTDPQKNPVLFIGQVKHLTALKYENIKCKLEPRVSEEVSILVIEVGGAPCVKQKTATRLYVCAWQTKCFRLILMK